MHLLACVYDACLVPVYAIAPTIADKLRAPLIERINAYHEAGHIVMARHSTHKNTIMGASITPNRTGRGETTFAVKKTKFLSDEERADWARVMYAGMAAERLLREDFHVLNFGGDSGDTFEASEAVNGLSGNRRQLRAQFKKEAEQTLIQHRDELDAVAAQLIKDRDLGRAKIKELTPQS